MENQNTNTMKNSKITVEEFANVLLEKESEAEYEIDDFDACNDHHWNDMMDLAIEYTYNHFMELGYTEDEVSEVHEEYNN